jgi:ABC-type lipoprotein release transport system permease subunit
MLITSLKDGMTHAVYLAAQGHYSGDLVVRGRNPGQELKNHMPKQLIDETLAAAERARLNPERIVFRTVVDSSRLDGTVLYYDGSYTPIMHTVGVDWENEEEYFNSLYYIDKQAEAFDDYTVVVSSPLASTLLLHVGDMIMLEMETKTGQKNTGNFIVGAIINDSSVLSFSRIFLSRRIMNDLILFSEGECSVIGFYFKGAENNSKIAEAKRLSLYEELKKEGVGVRKLPYSRAQYDAISSEGGSPGLVLATITVYLTEVAELLQALDLIEIFLYTMLLLIIFVSALVTYNLILRERAKDIGTMRAIGCYEQDLRLILFLEAFAAGTLAIIAGFVLMLLGTWIVSHFSFAWISGFDMFMQGGSLRPLYRAGTVLRNILAVYIILLAAFVPPAFRISRTELPGLLAGGVKE